MVELPDIENLLTRNRERVQGIRGWADIARLGRTNLRRLRELLAEDASAAASSEISSVERREFAQSAEALRDLHEHATEDKPCLVRFRVESFRAGDDVYVYAGDTPHSLVPNWVSGTIVAVAKAHRPEWNDGSPNAGYYWEVTIKPSRPVFSDAETLRCSTSEPRVQHFRDYRALFDALHSDPEFFRVFADNAQRSWSPLWCLERGLQIPVGASDVRAWFTSWTG
jgi:hypothetical protein